VAVEQLPRTFAQRNLDAALASGGDVEHVDSQWRRAVPVVASPPMAASQKTLPTGEDVRAFIAAVSDGARREDARRLCGLLADWTGEPPVMWGTSIVGFGSYRYRYESGHEGTAALVGFSARKANLVLYLVGGVKDRYPKLLEQLGPHKTGKGCLELRRLDDVNHEVLRQLVERTVRVHLAPIERAPPPDAQP
jgi:hypothetical protein